MPHPDYVHDLVATVRAASERLGRLTDAQAARRPAPGKWSAKEVIGHLIDSAGNNHQRFVRARWMDDLVFDGYDQDAWVAAQDYQGAPWPELLGLWSAFNLHLARVMRATPSELRAREHARHNLDRVAWQAFTPDAPATLDGFMADYVAHLKHHLGQIDAR